MPVKVTPALNGRWRWIGTRTLRFEFTGAVDRLPMATSYHVEVPAGTTSQSGHKLATAVAWTFRTPPPKVLTFAPGEHDGRHDAALHRDLRSARRSRRGHQDHHARRRRRNQGRDPPGDHRRDHRRRSGAPDLAGRARRPLGRVPARVAACRTAPRSRSRSGPALPRPRGREPRPPRRPTRPPPTRRSRSRASSAATATVAGREPASPSRSTTPSTRRRSTRASVKITPALDASIGVEGNTLTVNGRRSATRDTSCTSRRRSVTSSARRSARPKAEPFDVGEATPALMAFPQSLTTTDPSAKPSVSVTSVGQPDAQGRRLRHGSVAVARLPEPPRTVGERRPTARRRWRKLSTTTITVDGGGNDLTESTIDLSADLHGATGDLSRGRLADPAATPRTPTSTGRTARRSRGCRSRRSVSTRCRATTS